MSALILPNNIESENNLKVLFEPGNVYEVRILDVPRNGTVSGYFDNQEELEKAVAQYDGKGNIYHTLNPVKPALFARAANRLKPWAKATTGDLDILRQYWLLVDLDPKRPAGIMASAEEKEAAMQKGREVYAWLQAQGWPKPVLIDSGNGPHLRYPIDLPNDEASRGLLKNCLEALALRFDDEFVNIDCGVFNAGRIARLPGYMNVKGDNIESRPHRRSKFLNVPHELEQVPLDLLKNLADMIPKPQVEPNRLHFKGEFDLPKWITDHELPVVSTSNWNGGKRWVFDPCPWNSDHTNKSAYIVQLANGAIGAGCHHNSCQGKDWHSLRDMYEPGWREKHGAYAGFDDEWPEPEPIKNTLRPVKSIPLDIIPGPLRPWLKDISFRMQCPLDFVAVGAITEAGAIIGSGCGIRPKQKDDWLVVPNLWGGVVASPSMLKTPSLAEALKPLARLEAEARGVYETEVAFYEADVEEHKAKRDALKAEMSTAAKGKAKANEKVPDMDDVKARFAALEKPEEPIRRRYKTNDATVEKVGELLNQNPRGILIFRDELVGLLMSWEREDRQTDRAFYLETWNGYGSFTTDRIGRGTIDIKNMCISILGGIQPSKLTAYLYQANSDLQNDGLIQRFQLMVYPDETQNWKLVDEYPNTEAKNKAFDIFKRLAEMPFTENGAELPEGELIPFFHFSSEAQEIFNQWLTGLQEKLQIEESPLMVEHLAKYRSLMPSLALIFHLISIADGQAGGPVSFQAAQQAAEWCDYLESHAKRIYGLVADVSIRAAGELAQKIQAGKVNDGFTLRDVYRNCWHLLDKKELLQAACSELVEAGWLQECVSEKGKTKMVYSINPKIFL